MRGDAARRARGHAPRMPTACLIGENNLTFQKTLIFRKSLQNMWAGSSQGQGSPHGQAAKAKAKAKAKRQGRLACQPWGHALACKLPEGHGSTAWARGRGAGMPRGWDAKAVACPWDPSKAMAALGGSAAAKPSGP
ncbi:hypothetical protein CMV_028103 [Castanea mollissima]|uniref:Uncharacterized protein n=1 Tax=Castanea mollissima TaxID=60419 RepID=A0A8J4Q8U4_9ROSI|nr:hypothetical protein CMV_028103 [Castanea mollissima]